MMALSKLRLTRRDTHESLSQLHQTIDLVGGSGPFKVAGWAWEEGFVRYAYPGRLGQPDSRFAEVPRGRWVTQCDRDKQIYWI